MLLEGIRVIDFTWVVGGPVSTQFLGMMGAEVIKIETSSRPEYKKRTGWFPTLNGSKLSCTINLKDPEGQRLVKELVKESDVVIENFSTGVTEKLGIDYSSLTQINPQLIMLSMSGLGREGDSGNLLAYGSLLQAYSGWTSLVKETNLSVEGMGIRPPLTDHVAGLMGAMAILAAIKNRQKTGEGKFIDLSLMESIISLLTEPLIEISLTGKQPAILGNGSRRYSPHGCYPCQGEDSWVAMAVYDDNQWNKLVELMGNPEWARALATSEDRINNSESIDQNISQWTKTFNKVELSEKFRENGIPATVTNSFHDLIADQHLQQRNFFMKENGKLVKGLPWLDRNMGRGNIQPAPSLGKDNEYVFKHLLHLNDRQIADLSARGVLV
jgi:benzylsuccinate CoA-transferase BbsF subunit